MQIKWGYLGIPESLFTKAKNQPFSSLMFEPMYFFLEVYGEKSHIILFMDPQTIVNLWQLLIILVYLSVQYLLWREGKLYNSLLCHLIPPNYNTLLRFCTWKSCKLMGRRGLVFYVQ